MKRGDKTNTKEIQEIIIDYFENLNSNKFENLKKMDKFLGTNDHLKLNQETINHLNRSTTCDKIKAPIKSLPPQKKDLMDSSLNFARHLKN
jgi:hypothetical protein